jgi:hypothetical protein
MGIDRLIRALNDALDVKTRPAEGVTEGDIAKWYSSLYNYTSALGNSDESELRSIVSDVLAPYEFQAAQFVAREARAFASMSGAGIKVFFLEKIYAERDKYLFFQAREKLIDKLIELGAIREFGYKVTQPF